MPAATPTLVKVEQFGLSPTKPLNLRSRKASSSGSLVSQASQETRETRETTHTFETARERQSLQSDEPNVASLRIYDDDETPRVTQRAFPANDETPVVGDSDVFVPLGDETLMAPLAGAKGAVAMDANAYEPPASVGLTASKADWLRAEKAEHMSLNSKDGQAKDKGEMQRVNSQRSERSQLSRKGSQNASTEAHDTSYETTNSVNDFSLEAGSISQIVDSPELVSLFLYALHSFDSTTLDQTNDATVCLSFAKGDVVYVHSVDTSGWSEVTLLKSLQRGWVPINFFMVLVKDDRSLPLSRSRLPLKMLLISTARFLNNPMDSPFNSDAGFSLDHVNSIRDGVRYLLELTSCLSRTALIVKKRPIIRRMRKTLLADWYSLMIKADSYKHSFNPNHLETLHLMALQVVKKSITFLDIWAIESDLLKKEEPKEDIPKLKQPPLAKQRLGEMHNMLFGYIGLLLGRLDMVEHNAVGCQVLENITHQMILLLRELLFVNKSCVQILNSQNRKHNRSDDNLDVLLSLVSELVSSVKNFVTRTINEPQYESHEGPYMYTPEGDDLMGVVSRMARSIAVSVETCYRYLGMIGDFRLSADKDYADLTLVRITPEEFIKTCSKGILKSMDKKGLRQLKQKQQIKRQSRFSMIRGNTEAGGFNLLQEFLPDSQAFGRNSVFQPYLNESSENYEMAFDPDTEIVYDADGLLVGATFRALVHLLTDEVKPTDPSFVSTFFLTFKLFASGSELIEELISRFNLENRFDEDDTGDISVFMNRLKNRRRLITRMFQLWLQSYWDYANDYSLIPTLINFFNEGVSQFLPIESKVLIELCSKLIVVTPSKIQDAAVKTEGTVEGLQLVDRRSMISHSSSMQSLNKQLDDEGHIFEEYELAKHSGSRNSLLLPSLTFNSSLMGKSQVGEVEHLVIKHRALVGKVYWPVEPSVIYTPMDFSVMLTSWFACCQLRFTEAPCELNLVELNSFELAKQLTMLESKIFLAIKPGELLNQNFSKRTNLSPNIQHSLMFTNLLGSYVLESILEETLPFKKRASRLKSWLNVALSCYYLKNFNSLAAIVISLQSHSLSRLDELWDALSEKYQSLFQDLKKIIHPTNNYKGYRYKLGKILADGDSKSTVPVVPYVNLFLQDLTFVHEGNRDWRNSNTFLRKIVNFDKFVRVARIVGSVEYLQVGYEETVKKRRSSVFSFGSSIADETLTPIPQVQEYVMLELLRAHQLHVRDSERVWGLSKRLKP